MTEKEESKGATDRPAPLFRALELAALVLGSLAVLLFVSALTGLDRDAAAAPLQGQSRPAGTLLQSGPPLQAGDLPYEFALEDAGGNTVRLSDFLGQPVMVNFWATWCGSCRIEMPEMQAVYEARQEDGFVILAVNQGETAAQASQFFAEFGLTYNLLLDPDSTVLQRYGTGNFLPSSFFIAPSGEITAIHRGPLTQTQLRQYLEQILPG